MNNFLLYIIMAKSYSKKQKLYKMKGCSKSTRKNYLGGSNLAYTGKSMPYSPNPFLAYTGKGGSSCNSNLTPNLEIPTNTNAANPLMPNTGPINTGSFIPANVSTSGQRGGSCGCNAIPMTGGCGPLCAVGFMVGGVKHRLHCKCSSCKNKRSKKQSGGNEGIPYPAGLVGKPWTPSPQGWPGVDGISGDRNYISPNEYKTDVQMDITYTGPNTPFTVGGKKKHSKKQKGGTLSNFMGQDLINLGRQFQFGLGSAYNALAGYPAPVNPLPWKDQFQHSAR
jgi:hypothetical protein